MKLQDHFLFLLNNHTSYMTAQNIG